MPHRTWRCRRRWVGVKRCVARCGMVVAVVVAVWPVQCAWWRRCLLSRQRTVLRRGRCLLRCRARSVWRRRRTVGRGRAWAASTSQPMDVSTQRGPRALCGGALPALCRLFLRGTARTSCSEPPAPAGSRPGPNQGAGSRASACPVLSSILLFTTRRSAPALRAASQNKVVLVLPGATSYSVRASGVQPCATKPSLPCATASVTPSSWRIRRTRLASPRRARPARGRFG